MTTDAGPASRPVETVAGFMAAAAIFVSLIGIVYRPARITPVAVVVALVAAGIGGRHSRLAAFAVGITAVAWIAGMTVAMLTGDPLF